MNEILDSKKINTAVLFCVWVRPEITKQSFEQIRKVRPPRLYVAVDGPRNDEDRILIEKTLNEINVDWDCEVKYLKRDKNLGCKVAMSSAISWFFENEEKGIILEDDCFADESFFRYCEELLEKYQFDTRVMHISGRTRLNKCEIDNYKYSYYFQRAMDCWGWASWRRAWKYFDINMSDFNAFKEENAINMYIKDKQERKSLLEMWEKHASHNEKSWAWIYNYNLHCQNALCINSKTNLVTNIGFNSINSTHLQEDSDKIDNEITSMQFPLKHPIFIGEYIHKQKEVEFTFEDFCTFIKIFIQGVFSVKNENKYKVLRVLGFKIKIKREDKCK